MKSKRNVLMIAEYRLTRNIAVTKVGFRLQKYSISFEKVSSASYNEMTKIRRRSVAMDRTGQKETSHQMRPVLKRRFCCRRATPDAFLERFNPEKTRLRSKDIVEREVGEFIRPPLGSW